MRPRLNITLLNGARLGTRVSTHRLVSADGSHNVITLMVRRTQKPLAIIETETLSALEMADALTFAADEAATNGWTLP